MSELKRSAKDMIAIVTGILILGFLVWLIALKQNTATWYSVPFKKGEAYVTRDRIVGAFDTLEKDTVLVYESTGFSRYDGYIGFFFIDSEERKRRWDLHDHQDPDIEAAKLFAWTAKKAPNQSPDPTRFARGSY